MTSTVGTRTARHLTAPRSAAQRGVAVRAAIALGVGALLLTACSGTTGSSSTATGSTAATSDTTSTAAPAAAAPTQKVPLGRTVTLPTDTFAVSAFLDHAAPKFPKPDTPGTHWASFNVNQCATAASAQGRWEVALADGTVASEPTTWYGDLPQILMPDGDPYAAGDCAKGRVYIEMPEGGVATAIVLQPKVAGPARPEVQWLIGRTSAAS